MIGYITVGTNDLRRAAGFYDGVLGTLGAKRAMEIPDHAVVWNIGDSPALTAIKPHDGKPATAGNGMMVALSAQNRADVDATYSKALELGGTDEGAVGFRSDNFYVGYFRDLDGNKLAVFYMEPAKER